MSYKLIITKIQKARGELKNKIKNSQGNMGPPGPSSNIANPEYSNTNEAQENDPKFNHMKTRGS